MAPGTVVRMTWEVQPGRHESVRVRIVEDFGDGFLKVQRLDTYQFGLPRDLIRAPRPTRRTS